MATIRGRSSAPVPLRRPARPHEATPCRGKKRAAPWSWPVRFPPAKQAVPLAAPTPPKTKVVRMFLALNRMASSLNLGQYSRAGSTPTAHLTELFS